MNGGKVSGKGKVRCTKIGQAKNGQWWPASEVDRLGRILGGRTELLVQLIVYRE